MTEQQQSDSEAKQSVFGVIVHSFFVIPFLLAIFSVLLFMSVRILTMEDKSVYDYLEDVKTGGVTKRWQSAFELSKILGNPELVPDEARFVDEVNAAYAQAKHDDSKVRQYLALAMGRTGKEAFVQPLIKSLAEEKDENLIAIIYSLGILKHAEPVPYLLEYLDHPLPHVRLAAVTALGNIGDKSAAMRIKPLLNDPEPNVGWEAAVALAKMGDASGAGVLLNLLDRDYLSQYPHVDTQEQSHIMLVAIQSGAHLKNEDINKRIARLARSDRNMKVRRTAFDTLKNVTNPKPKS